MKQHAKQLNMLFVPIMKKIQIETIAYGIKNDIPLSSVVAIDKKNRPGTGTYF